MIPAFANGSIACTPGNFFRLLYADSTLNNLYGRGNSIHYETAADRLGFLSTAKAFGLESPLGETTCDGGYFVYIARQEWAEMLGQADRSQDILPGNFAANADWRRVTAFADQWHAGNPLRNKLANGLWFEIDVCGPPSDVPVPSIFFGVKNVSVNESIAAIQQGLAALNIDLPAAQRDLLITCLRTIGPLSASFQIGLMLARPASPLRLCAFKVGLPDIMDILRKLGITALEDYHDFLQEFLHLGLECSAIDIDIGASFGTKAGIEVKFSSAATVREQQQNQGWPAFLDRLVNKGCCLPPKSLAVLNWIGGHRYDPAPYDLGVPQKAILRTISHIKLDFQPGFPLRAKAYLNYVVS